MKYTDFGEILQDDFTGTKFGDKRQLEVIGYTKNLKKPYSNKLYILKCSVCSQDEELFGDGIFKSLKGNLANALPCGCAHKPNWSKDQYEILCERKAKERLYKFIGFSGDWKGNKTKLLLSCQYHGDWNTTSINDFISSGKGCLQCYRETIHRRVRKSDEEMIASFFASGAFHPETKFWRSDRKNRAGSRIYWNMLCGECGVLCSSIGANLQKGSKPCDCATKQTYAYVNLVEDSGVPVALKFGIASIVERRVYEQNLRSPFSIINIKKYKFPSKGLCKKAESDCKKEFITCLLNSTEMPDGWTETTSINNLEKIIEIYINNGAIEL